MKHLTPRAILVVYLVLFITLGVSAYWLSGMVYLPNPTDKQAVEELKNTVNDQNLAKLYDQAFSELRERHRRFADATMSGFSTVLGALIGFLSASWAGRNREPENNDSSTTR